MWAKLSVSLRCTCNILLFSFNKGEVDEMRMNPEQFATQTLVGSDFDKAGGVKIKAPQWAFSYIGWNQDGSNPFFNDKRVRLALSMAIAETAAKRTRARSSPSVNRRDDLFSAT